jgi:hypothetical protein
LIEAESPKKVKKDKAAKKEKKRKSDDMDVDGDEQEEQEGKKKKVKLSKEEKKALKKAKKEAEAAGVSDGDQLGKAIILLMPRLFIRPLTQMERRKRRRRRVRPSCSHLTISTWVTLFVYYRSCIVVFLSCSCYPYP